MDDVWAWAPHAVVVASPSHLHLAQALDAARRGCHLFIEKPLGNSLDGVPDLLALVAERQLVTMVGCNMRFHPGPATVKRLLDDGAIGPPLFGRLQTSSYLPDWRPGTDYRQSYSASVETGGGAILDCIHELDLAIWFFGRATLESAAIVSAASLGISTEGLAELLLRHESGVLSSVHLSYMQRDYRRGCQVVGETGTLYWDFASPEVRIERGTATSVEALPADWQVNQMYVDELSHFVRAVIGRTATTCPVTTGADVLGLALGARSASLAGAR